MEPSTNNFPADELRCKCPECRSTQPNKCDPVALAKLQQLREAFGEPMPLNSAYRCPKHPVEARKAKPGTHAQGVAFDVSIPWGAERMRLLQLAIEAGAEGFGFADTFLHIDFADRPHSTSWGY